MSAVPGIYMDTNRHGGSFQIILDLMIVMQSATKPSIKSVDLSTINIEVLLFVIATR